MLPYLSIASNLQQWTAAEHPEHITLHQCKPRGSSEFSNPKLSILIERATFNLYLHRQRATQIKQFHRKSFHPVPIGRTKNIQNYELN